MPADDPTVGAIDSHGHGRLWDFLARVGRALRRVGGDRLILFLARLAYRLTITGEEAVPATGACLVVCNHESVITDALVYLAIRRHRRDLYVLGWQNLRGESPMYDFMRRFGEQDLDSRYLRVYKARGLSAATLLRAREVLLEGGVVFLAPEGELTWDGRLQYPLTPGAAWLAMRTGAPVLPVVSTGGYDLQPRWRMDKMAFIGRVSIRIGQPFHVCPAPVTRVADEALQETVQAIWDTMAALLPPGKAQPPT